MCFIGFILLFMFVLCYFIFVYRSSSVVCGNAGGTQVWFSIEYLPESKFLRFGEWSIWAWTIAVVVSSTNG